MANDKVLTAPLAVIKVNGIAIGKMRNIRYTENIRRARVVGLGTLVPDEAPAIEWSATLTCSFMSIDMKKSMVPGAINRIAGSIEQFVNNVLLQEDGVQIDIMRRVKDPQQPDNLFPNVSSDPNFIQRQIKGKLETFASVRGCFITREGLDINEGSISGRDVEFDVIEPLTYSNM